MNTTFDMLTCNALLAYVYGLTHCKLKKLHEAVLNDG